jgi:hypothetical protein
VSNNEIVPGFDEEIPRLDPSWGGGIAWRAIHVNLARIPQCPQGLLIEMEGELEAFNGSYLAGRLKHAIKSGFNRLLLDMRKVTLGDYREVLVSSAGKEVVRAGGWMVLLQPPALLTQYWDMIGLSRMLGGFSIARSMEVALEMLRGQPSMSIHDDVRIEDEHNNYALPRNEKCPICRKLVVLRIPGRFRCPKCNSRLVIRTNGNFQRLP